MDKELDETLHMAVAFLKRESAMAQPPVYIDPPKDLHIRIQPQMAPLLYRELTPDVLDYNPGNEPANWRGLAIVVTKHHAPERGCFVYRSPNGKGGGLEVQGDTIRLTEHWKTQYIPVALPGDDLQKTPNE